jgi:carbon-monoxide dehydrogenase medium subunit
VFLRLDKDGKTCREAKIALGAVAPTPIRAPKAEKVLIHLAIDQNLAEEAGRVASREASPISNIRASMEYRTDMIGVLTKRAVMKAFKRVQGKSNH